MTAGALVSGDVEDMRVSRVTISDVTFAADLSGALFWEEQRLLVVSDLHLEKGSSFASRGVLLPPYDTIATLGRLAAVISRHDPRTVIALGDSFHDRTAHERLSAEDRDAVAGLQSGRDWIWISGNHDPMLPRDLGGTVADEVAIGPITFRHEQTGALHPRGAIDVQNASSGSVGRPSAATFRAVVAAGRASRYLLSFFFESRFPGTGESTIILNILNLMFTDFVKI